MEELINQIDTMNKRIRRRDFLEIGVAMMLILISILLATILPTLMAKGAILLIIPYALGVIYKLRKAKKGKNRKPECFNERRPRPAASLLQSTTSVIKIGNILVYLASDWHRTGFISCYRDAHSTVFNFYWLLGTFWRSSILAKPARREDGN